MKNLLTAFLFGLCATLNSSQADEPPLTSTQVADLAARIAKGYGVMAVPNLGDYVEGSCTQKGYASLICKFLYDPAMTNGQLAQHLNYTFMNLLTVEMSYLDWIPGESISRFEQKEIDRDAYFASRKR